MLYYSTGEEIKLGDQVKDISGGGTYLEGYVTAIHDGGTLLRIELTGNTKMGHHGSLQSPILEELEGHLVLKAWNVLTNKAVFLQRGTLEKELPKDTSDEVDSKPVKKFYYKNGERVLNNDVVTFNSSLGRTEKGRVIAYDPGDGLIVVESLDGNGTNGIGSSVKNLRFIEGGECKANSGYNGWWTCVRDLTLLNRDGKVEPVKEPSKKPMSWTKGFKIGDRVEYRGELATIQGFRCRDRDRIGSGNVRLVFDRAVSFGHNNYLAIYDFDECGNEYKYNYEEKERIYFTRINQIVKVKDPPLTNLSVINSSTTNPFYTNDDLSCIYTPDACTTTSSVTISRFYNDDTKHDIVEPKKQSKTTIATDIIDIVIV